MGPTLDPLVQDVQYDFNISVNLSCSNHSTLKEHESEY